MKAMFRFIPEAEILKSFFQGLFLQGQYLCWPDMMHCYNCTVLGTWYLVPGEGAFTWKQNQVTLVSPWDLVPGNRYQAPYFVLRYLVPGTGELLSITRTQKCSRSRNLEIVLRSRFTFNGQGVPGVLKFLHSGTKLPLFWRSMLKSAIFIPKNSAQYCP